MLRIILSLIISYLLGAVPFAYLIGRMRGVDLRKAGSGNVGATNAFRVLGPAWGITALLLDTAKGALCPTLVAEYLAHAQDLSWGMFLRIILSIIVVAGHNWTIFLGFRGGKGVAASLGVFIGFSFISPALRISLFCSLLSWVAVFLLSGFVSLGSIVAALVFPLFLVLFLAPQELFILALFLSLFILIRHKSNIYRLLHRKENRFHIFSRA